MSDSEQRLFTLSDVDYEVALCAYHFWISGLSEKLGQALVADPRDEAEIQRIEREIDRLCDERDLLSSSDAQGIRRVIETYGPLVRDAFK
jgi:hypothetical protein